MGPTRTQNCPFEAEPAAPPGVGSSNRRRIRTRNYLLALLVGAGVLLPRDRALPQAPPAVAAPYALTAAPAVGMVPDPAPPVCKATAAILVDATTGTVLYKKNSRHRRAVASTTKIMAAVVAMESGRLSELVSFSQQAVKTPYANLNAKPGERVRLYDLLYAIMMRSSNDSCVAVGEHLFGSGLAYAQAMTRRARELGATDTQFITPNGLHDARHYSTAQDLAVMARYALQIPLFNDIVRTQAFTLERSINQKDTLIKNHNRFLTRYDGADGVKTGYVKEAGRCLVASATRLDQGRPWRLISVVLNSPEMYEDSTRLMDWGRLQFQPVFLAAAGQPVGTARVEGGNPGELPLIATHDLRVILPRGLAGAREYSLDRRLRAPLHEAQRVGTLSARMAGLSLGAVEVVAGQAVAQSWTAAAAPWTGALLAGAALWWGPRNARTFTKSRCRRRRRIPAGRDHTD